MAVSGEQGDQQTTSPERPSWCLSVWPEWDKQQHKHTAQMPVPTHSLAVSPQRPFPGPDAKAGSGGAPGGHREQRGMSGRGNTGPRRESWVMPSQQLPDAFGLQFESKK